MSCVVFRLSPDQRSVEAVFNPTNFDSTFTQQSLKKQLEGSEYSQFKRLDSGLDELFSAVKNPPNSPEQEVVAFIVANRLDAELSLVMSPDQMSATATITAAYGGDPITPEHFRQALQELGIIAGIDAKAVSTLLEGAQEGAPGAVFSAIVARGATAVKGTDGCWISDVETLRQQFKPQERKDGSIDLHDFGKILTVKSGQLVMHRQPPTAGEDGFTVIGTPLPAVPGVEAEFVSAEGVVLSDDGDLINASRGGLPVYIPGGIRIDNVYSVKNVDLASGDIVFDGSVIIQQDVEAGMKVSATGDVTVGGAVYFASIEAGGDIVVRNGVVGNQRQDDNNHFDSSNLSCSLIAKGSLSLGFAQYARLKAERGIQVTKQLLHCLTSTQGDIDIGKGGDRNSKLIGGVTRARNRISCGIYGNEAFVATEIELCPDIQGLRDEASIFDEQIAFKQQLIEDLKRVLPKVQSLPKGAVRQEKLTKMLNTINHTGQQIKALSQNILDLKQQESERIEAASVVALKTLFPNVRSTIAGHKFKTSRTYQGGGLCYRHQEVLHDPSLK